MTGGDDQSPGSLPGPMGAAPGPQDLAEIDRLRQEIAAMEAEIQDCAQGVRQLQNEEQGGGPVRAQEIFQLKQKRMMLGTEIHHRKVRINLILFNS